MPNNKLIIQITEDFNNQRIDLALSKLTEYSRSMIQKLIHQNHILLNEDPILKANHLVKSLEQYKIRPPKNILTEIEPEPYNLEILYEDSNLIVLNKPAHLIVHPGAGNPNNTLINKLAYYCKLSDFNGPNRLGTVHRLDKGVSGCIIFAKNNNTHMFLNQQFADRTVEKQYIAICHGILHPAEIYLEDYITRNKLHRQKMQTTTISSHGKIAQMNIKLLKINKNLSMIECNPITGRTHQIRVQLSNIKMPILGDKLYGLKDEPPMIQETFKERIALHSKQIKFLTPNGEKMLIEAPLPKEFETIFI